MNLFDNMSAENADEYLLTSLDFLEEKILEIQEEEDVEFLIELHNKIMEYLNDFVLGVTNKIFIFNEKVFETRCVHIIQRIHVIIKISFGNIESQTSKIINLFSLYFTGIHLLMSTYFDILKSEILDYCKTYILEYKESVDYMKLSNLFLLSPEMNN